MEADTWEALLRNLITTKIPLIWTSSLILDLKKEELW